MARVLRLSNRAFVSLSRLAFSVRSCQKLKPRVHFGVAWLGQALSKAWRFGQKMRQFFDYGDVRDAVTSQMELQRKQVRVRFVYWIWGSLVG